MGLVFPDRPLAQAEEVADVAWPQDAADEAAARKRGASEEDAELTPPRAT